MGRGGDLIKGWEQKQKGRRRSEALMDRKRYLIVSNGLTEKVYLKHYRISTGPIIKIREKSGIDPRKLVEQAIRIRDDMARTQDFDLNNDETWAVFDRDINKADTKNKGQFNEALQIAKNNNVMVGYSNDAFELWFVLHYQDLATATHRKDLFSLLEKHRGKKYKKGGGTDLYEEIKSFRSDAIKRAKTLHERMSEVSPVDANPSTTIYVLLERIMADPSFKG